MYFPLQRLVDTANICSATIKGTPEDLMALIEQLKSNGFDLKTSILYFQKMFATDESDWKVDIVFFLQNGPKKVVNSDCKIKSTCFSVFEGFREDLSVLLEQLTTRGFNIKASDFYPSYCQPDNRIVSRIYINFIEC